MPYFVIDKKNINYVFRTFYIYTTNYTNVNLKKNPLNYTTFINGFNINIF